MVAVKAVRGPKVRRKPFYHKKFARARNSFVAATSETNL
jgi:hypothetical protein